MWQWKALRVTCEYVWATETPSKHVFSFEHATFLLRTDLYGHRPRIYDELKLNFSKTLPRVDFLENDSAVFDNSDDTLSVQVFFAQFFYSQIGP